MLQISFNSLNNSKRYLLHLNCIALWIQFGKLVRKLNCYFSYFINNMGDDNKLYLGLDCSTQQLKAVIVDRLKPIHVFAVSFDEELPEFGTVGGVHKSADGLVVTAPTLMWVKALDLLLERMRLKGVPFERIAAISGSGQDAFSVSESPIWMDSSTEKQCRNLENAAGGALALAELTGSRAYHRFTGNQIAKMFQEQPDAYHSTERISLVSSFMASLFLGDFAPIDIGDGSGMNLMDIRRYEFVHELMEAIAPNLKPKLGDPVPSDHVCGVISNYFVQRFGFSSQCKVVAFTGDNLGSIAGINMYPGDIAISLGTSDTVLVWLDKPHASTSMHVLCNSIQKDAFIGMLCYKNGSFTRERIRKAVGCSDWSAFNSLLSQTPAGNNGCIGFYFDFAEILPNVPAADHRFDADGKQVDSFLPAVEARAVIEGQCLAKKLHCQQSGFEPGTEGGASANTLLLQTLADVFNQRVFVAEISSSAALGSAYLAKHATKTDLTKISFNQLCAAVDVDASFVCAAEPNEENVHVYKKLIQRYEEVEKKVIGVAS